MAAVDQPRSIAIIGAGVAGIRTAFHIANLSRLAGVSGCTGAVFEPGLQALRALQQVPQVQALPTFFRNAIKYLWALSCDCGMVPGCRLGLDAYRTCILCVSTRKFRG